MATEAEGENNAQPLRNLCPKSSCQSSKQPKCLLFPVIQKIRASADFLQKAATQAGSSKPEGAN